MVKLEYRPYLLALLGLTVCVSLYEIVYVQWDYGPGLPPTASSDSSVEVTNNDSSQQQKQGNTRPVRTFDHRNQLLLPQNGQQGLNNNNNNHYNNNYHKNNFNNGSRRGGGGGGASSMPLDQGKTGHRDILSSGNNLNSGAEENNHVPTIPESAAFNLEKLPKNDFRNLIDIENDFDFLINQKPCPARTTNILHSPAPQQPQQQHGTSNSSSSSSVNGAAAVFQQEDPLLVLVLVHSAPRNFRKRLTIRQTWANHPDPGLRVYFMLGAVDSRTLQFKLEMENERFGDLIQGNFTDAYRNMTYKHVMALKWFTYFCADTPMLLKTDDDVFVNSPALMEYVRENVDGIRSRRLLIKCRVLEKGAVKRTYRSKWRVSTKEYPNAEYPPYCPGFIVLYSGDIVQELYRAAQQTKYFWIDDVHVTGTLAQQVNATLVPFRDVFFKEKNRKRLREPYVRNMPLFTDPDLKEQEIRRMWRMVVMAGSEGSRFVESMQEDNEAVAYLSVDMDSGAGRVSLGMSPLRCIIMVVGALVLGLVGSRRRRVIVC